MTLDLALPATPTSDGPVSPFCSPAKQIPLREFAVESATRPLFSLAAPRADVSPLGSSRVVEGVMPSPVGSSFGRSFSSIPVPAGSLSGVSSPVGSGKTGISPLALRKSLLPRLTITPVVSDSPGAAARISSVGIATLSTPLLPLLGTPSPLQEDATVPDPIAIALERDAFWPSRQATQMSTLLRAEGATGLEGFGQGSFGQVYRLRGLPGQLLKVESLRAVGALRPYSSDRGPHLASFFGEHAAIPSVIFYDSSGSIRTAPEEGSVPLAMLMPEMEGGTLAEYMRQKRGPLPECEVIEIGQQVLRAVETASKHGIAHRDLHPANIARTCERRANLHPANIARTCDERRAKWKLIDWGRIMKYLLPNRHPETPLGIPRFTAPERLASTDNPVPCVEDPTKMEVFSVGKILVSALKLDSGDPFAPSLFQPGNPLHSLIDQMTKPDPAHRISASDALSRFDQLAARETAKWDLEQESGELPRSMAEYGSGL